MLSDGEFNQAFASFSRRENLPSSLSSAEWESVPSEIRDRAFFMAKVMDAEILQRFRDGVNDIMEGRTGQVTAEKEIFMWLEDRGYKPPDGKAGGLEDLSSLDRINVVLRTNLALASNHAAWARSQTSIKAFPCKELFRISQRMEPRDWDFTWNQAKSELAHIPGVHPTLKIALLNHPIWWKISRFDTPYPVFDYGSGMTTRAISRTKAIELGFKLDPNDPMQKPIYRSVNDALEVTPQVSDPKFRESLKDKLGRFAEEDENGKIIFTDPDGSKKYTAKKLSEVWGKPAPAGYDRLAQKDALEAWKDGFDEESQEERIILRRLFDRIENEDESMRDLWRISQLSSKDSKRILEGIEKGGLNIPGNVSGWSWSDTLPISSLVNDASSWSVIMQIKGASKAIDIRALRTDKPGFITVGGTQFKVVELSKDDLMKNITIKLEEIK